VVSAVLGGRPCLRRAVRVARAPFPIVFPGLGPRSCTKANEGWLASCTVRFRGHPSPKDLPLGLSSIPNSPVLWAKLPMLWTLRFHSPKANPTDRVTHIPKFRTSSKSPVCERSHHRPASTSVGLIFASCGVFKVLASECVGYGCAVPSFSRAATLTCVCWRKRCSLPQGERTSCRRRPCWIVLCSIHGEIP
jgi:hypothetical protein